MTMTRTRRARTMISTSSRRANPFRSSALALCAALLNTAFFAAALPARADDRVPEATAFMKKTVDDVLAILNDKSLKPGERLPKLEAIALERFDFPRMSMLVLGKN